MYLWEAICVIYSKIHKCINKRQPLLLIFTVSVLCGTLMSRPWPSKTDQWHLQSMDRLK